MPSTITFRHGQVVVVNVKRVLGTLPTDDVLRIEQGLREAFGL